MARKGQEPAVAWSPHDTAVWHTLRVVEAVRERRAELLPRVMTPFRPHLAEQEVVIAHGQFQLLTFRPVGDGSYVQNNGFFFATGGAGLAATAAFAIGQSSGNKRRRQQAAAMATPRWVPDDSGAIWVSTAGFYLNSPLGLRPWPWSSVVTTSLTAPGSIRVQGESTTGPVDWILQSDWAELAFVCWAMSQHPDHPQFVGRTWVPPGWDERDAARGRAEQASRAEASRDLGPA